MIVIIANKLRNSLSFILCVPRFQCCGSTSCQATRCEAVALIHAAVVVQWEVATKLTTSVKPWNLLVINVDDFDTVNTSWATLGIEESGKDLYDIVWWFNRLEFIGRY
jgi:hypothetical protein